jgi:NAD(P)-dependent dehydrogenase (short-subunit alcohol dehydrogenase family)
VNASEFTFHDQTVLITGAGRGIGKRLAIGFAAAGARVALMGRTQTELDLANLEIQHSGGSAQRLCADVREAEQVRAALERLRKNLGFPNLVITAAGVQGPVGQLAFTDPSCFREVTEVFLLGLMNVARAVLPDMMERRAGKIIALIGRGANASRPTLAPYAAAQAGIVRLVESLADEVRDHNIQVNCLDPGLTYTHMTEQILASGTSAHPREREEGLQALRSGGTPAEKQLQLAMFLASERSNHISGKLLHANDDWKRLERTQVHRELFTLRRVVKL